MHDIVKRTWSALNGGLIFDITFRRDWRRGDAETPAVALVTSRYEPLETRLIEMRRDRPTDFRLRFRSGCNVEGVLQELGHIVIEGADNLGIFADIRFCAPRSDEIYFEGLMATCPSGAARPSHSISPKTDPGANDAPRA